MKSEIAGEFPSDWERVPGEKIEYRKKSDSYELRTRETIGFCDRCGKKGLGYSLSAADSSGGYISKSGAYWCPTCGEGMNPEEYENFVKNELITPEM